MLTTANPFKPRCCINSPQSCPPREHVRLINLTVFPLQSRQHQNIVWIYSRGQEGKIVGSRPDHSDDGMCCTSYLILVLVLSKGGGRGGNRRNAETWEPHQDTAQMGRGVGGGRTRKGERRGLCEAKKKKPTGQIEKGRANKRQNKMKRQHVLPFSSCVSILLKKNHIWAVSPPAVFLLLSIYCSEEGGKKATNT